LVLPFSRALLCQSSLGGSVSVMDIKNIKTSELALAEQKLNKERLLVGSIKSLRIPFWFDRSCKITEKKLQTNLFICYLKIHSLGQNSTEKILDICSRLDMPGYLFNSFQKIIPALSSVYFGFEEEDGTCSYEVYGEYAVDRKSLSKLTEQSPAMSPMYRGMQFRTRKRV
jgi:hypothetical protein